MPRIEIDTYIHAPREIIFDLSRSIDLHKISTSHTKEEAIAGRTSGLLKLYETITWRARHLGVYQKLTSKITAYNRPECFTDEMVKGTFQSFKHDHIFITQEGGTLMRDIFIYKSPFGLLGRIADKLFLKNYMKKLLERRNAVIKEFAESNRWKEILDFSEK